MEWTMPYCGVELTWEQLQSYFGLKLPATVKIGTAELTEDEAYTLYTQGLYIVSYTRIYKVCYGGKGKAHFYGRVIYAQKRRPGEPGIARRGRWHVYDRQEVDRLIQSLEGETIS